MKRVYLATSYTALGWKKKFWLTRKLTEWFRYYKVTKCLAKMAVRFESEVNVFSPITHSHPLTPWIPDRLNTHSFWLGIDFNWIDTCDELWVYCQPGFDTSYGVNEEIKYARSKGMPVSFITDDGKYNFSI
jgi:hypothetical protein